jgi:hypothetical protein
VLFNDGERLKVVDQKSAGPFNGRTRLIMCHLVMIMPDPPYDHHGVHPMVLRDASE